MILINGLCRGSQCLSRSDVVTFNCLFKPAEPPFSKEEKDYGQSLGNQNMQLILTLQNKLL